MAPLSIIAALLSSQIQLIHTQDGRKALIPLMHDLRANNTFAARHAHQTPALSNIDTILKKASQECIRPSQLYIIYTVAASQLFFLCFGHCGCYFLCTPAFLCSVYILGVSCITKKCQNGLIPLSSSSYRSSRILHLPSCESSPQLLPKLHLATPSSTQTPHCQKLDTIFTLFSTSCMIM